MMKHCRKNVPLDGSGAESLTELRTSKQKLERRKESPRIKTDGEILREDFYLINNTQDQEVR